MKPAQTLVVLALTALTGCSFYARGPEDYRKATRELLDTKSNKIEACYKRQLKDNEKEKGTVVVRFEVEAKTGSIVKAKVVEKKTTAGDELQKCVLDALEGLTLAPPDQRTGEATFEWDFARAKP